MPIFFSNMINSIIEGAYMVYILN